MSTSVLDFVNKQPLLLYYVTQGLINLNALARFIKKNNKELDTTLTVSAISMELRRGIGKLSFSHKHTLNFQKYNLKIIARSNIYEAVIRKDSINKKEYLNIVNTISSANDFISIVEGEKEIVIMTDYSLRNMLSKQRNTIKIENYTEGLSFISINFPIELRLMPGVYSMITTALAVKNISIHSFHTIGGEILILVKDEDLLKTQHILELVIKR